LIKHLISAPNRVAKTLITSAVMFQRRHIKTSTTLLALLGLLIIVGCTPSHPLSTFDANGPVAQRQLDLFMVTFWVSAFIFVTVGSGLIYTVIKFRRKPGQGIPKQVHGNTKLEIGWTIVPIILLGAMAIPTVITQFYISEPPAGDQLTINVVAHQWWWDIKYPESGVITANELHVPVGTTINVEMTSNDVIHSFWVPKLAGKLDIMPGKTTSLWFRADEVGEYFGQCAEFCGESHAWMKFRVFAEPIAEFEAWQQKQLANAANPTTAEETQGASTFVAKGCIACHSISGVLGAAGVIGPNLTHLGGRSTIAAGVMDMNQDNLRKWLTDPNEIKPGNIMSNSPVSLAYTNPNFALTTEDINNLVAFLHSLK
jgi:cytochrome c oxidase subunit 2